MDEDRVIKPRRKKTEQEKRIYRGAAILKRLERHYLGEIELTSSQIKAAEAILKYTLPTFKAHTLQAEIKQDITVTAIEETLIKP